MSGSNSSINLHIGDLAMAKKDESKKTEESPAQAAEQQMSKAGKERDSASPQGESVDQPGGGEEQEKHLKGVLVDLDAAALEYRTPGWRQAALMRLMGWENGKKVSLAEYENALERLNNRRQGGGRL